MRVHSSLTVDEPAPHRDSLCVSPLAKLRNAGTIGVYADSADADEIASNLTTDQGWIPAEISGNTTNQQFMLKMIRKYPNLWFDKRWIAEVSDLVSGPHQIERSAASYTALCTQVARRIAARMAGGGSWEISLPLRLGVYFDHQQARRLCVHLADQVPRALVKISFAPHDPGFLLLARDLERRGIPVNVTGMFSVRQAVAAAIIVGATRTSIFMGRINRGVGAAFLGEHVILSAQRCLKRLRCEGLTKSRLIVSSVKEPRSVAETAGCDYITAPCETIRAFMEQELGPVEVTSQLETSYESRLGLDDRAIHELGLSRIARLYHLEIEFLEFLTELRKRLNKEAIQDPDKLSALFEQNGFGEIFYSPSSAEWRDLRRSRLPDLTGEITKRIPLDTLYSLLAFADFKTAEENIDAEIKRALL